MPALRHRIPSSTRTVASSLAAKRPGLVIACLILVVARSVAADSTVDSAALSVADTLAGRLPKVVSSGTYVITTDVVVPQGKTVLIEPGTVLLFGGFTGVKVHGTLLARGKKDRPIVFTSVNNGEYNSGAEVEAAPYDWNGIHILEDGAGTHFAYCAISYSVYGIMSLTKYIRLGPTVFRWNGRANLTIAGEEHEVGDEPYEYAITVQQAAGEGVPLTVLRDPNAPKRNIARYTGLAAMIGGGALAVVYTRDFSSSLQTFDQMSSTRPHNLAEHSSSAWQKQRTATVSDMLLMIGGYALGVAGAAGFGWSFTF